MIQVEDEKMIFLDANAFYSYYGRSKLGMTSEPVDEERLKKYLEQQREKSLPTSVYIEIMTHFRNNPKVLEYNGYNMKPKKRNITQTIYKHKR